MKRDDNIITDPLALALTRPTTVLGVPYQGVLIESLLAIEGLIWSHDLRWLLVALPLHALCYLVTLHDPRAFGVLLVWWRTTALASRWHWSASTYGVLPVTRRRSLLQRLLRRTP